jgi:hypothetical protein
MSNFTCNFCAHGNPEGSKYCNECGSPLNLALCSRCEAINSVSATQCYQCGAPLPSVEAEEIAIPRAALTEIAQSERLPTKDDPVPIALGERLDQLLGDPLVKPREPQEATSEDRPSFAAALTADPASRDNDGSLGPSHSGGATYPRRNPSRARGFLLVVSVAVAGAVYWTSLGPTHPPDLQTMTDEGRAIVPEPASSAPAVAAEPADTPKQPPTGDALTTADSRPSSAASFELPTTGRESISPAAEASPSTASSSESSASAREIRSHGADVAAPQLAAQAPESKDAQAPSHAEAADSLGYGTAKITSVRAGGDPRRMVTQGRTKEQAERDAIATSSLIERELANSPPADSENKPPSGL